MYRVLLCDLYLLGKNKRIVTEKCATFSGYVYVLTKLHYDKTYVWEKKYIEFLWSNFTHYLSHLSTSPGTAGGEAVHWCTSRILSH